MFRAADLVLITKTDLLEHLPHVRIETIVANLARVMPRPQFLEMSATTGQGIAAWTAWLDALRPAAVSLAAEAHR
jgi:hydrogenase nickel incorporation protein HypB